VSICGLLLLVSYFRSPAITFDNLKQAQSRIAAAGYHCRSDRADGMLEFGFLVTHESVDWPVVAELMKVEPFGPEWHGKVWIAILGDQFELSSIPNVPGTRIWGKTVAFGDPEFLDEIEKAIRRI